MSSPITLTTSQAAALDTLLRFAKGQTGQSMAVLHGWAGTGKTTVVARLLQTLVAEGYGPIAVAAPTNKAVRVLRGKITEAGLAMPDAPVEMGRMSCAPVSFGSIHSLLGLQMSELEDGTQECKQARDSSIHEYDMVVVDECSMAGDDLFRRIATAKRRTLILFVGDSAQLPPIQPNEAVSPTFSQVQLQITLSEVVRQAKDNPIIRLSMVIREHIEAGTRISPQTLAAALPPLPAKAGLVTGDARTVAAFVLAEIQAGRDARAISFTNAAVLGYNAAIHEALHGRTERPYVVGERVIVHSQCEAIACDPAGRATGLKVALITSEELMVRAITSGAHPRFPDLPADQYNLEQDDGSTVAVFVATNQPAVDRAVTEAFGRWRQLKARADELANIGRNNEAGDLRDQAKRASGEAWALKRAFAPLRHAYALTAHKSQGSTFDTAVVDLSDLAKMRSTFQFNRALYVAATRAAEHLAIIA